MSEKISKEFTPWEDDEIEFVPGNWVIKRNRYEGLYDYTFFDVEAGAPVDAFQLVQWGMAKVKTYDSLYPWENSEITFKSGVEVMRDLTTVNSAPKDKTYILRERGGFVRCNKYYLVLKGYALPSRTFLKSVEKGKPKLKSNEKIFWDEDNLVVIQRDGITVEKGARAGLYRVMRGRLALNYSAARILEEGLGISVIDYKIRLREKHSDIAWKTYREELHGFWMNAQPEAITTLRDVAMVWDGMASNPDDENLRRIIDFNSGVYQKALTQRGYVDAIKEMSSQLLVRENDYNAIYMEASAVGNLLKDKFGGTLNIFTDLKNFEELEGKFRVQKNRLSHWREGVRAIRDETSYRCIFILNDVDNPKKPFPVKCLPQRNITRKNIMEYEFAVDSAEKVKAAVKDAYDAFVGKIDELLNRDIELKTLTDRVKFISNVVENIRQERVMLDKFNSEQLHGFIDYDKKPGLFCRPHKSDPIRFTSNAKIKIKKYTYYYMYEVRGRYGTIEVNSHGLIYLGLAVWK